ncbi:MAG: hypothetical protein ACRDRH_29005 [Pseudonocardia sp.]
MSARPAEPPRSRARAGRRRPGRREIAVAAGLPCSSEVERRRDVHRRRSTRPQQRLLAQRGVEVKQILHTPPVHPELVGHDRPRELRPRRRSDDVLGDGMGVTELSPRDR